MINKFLLPETSQSTTKNISGTKSAIKYKRFLGNSRKTPTLYKGPSLFEEGHDT